MNAVKLNEETGEINVESEDSNEETEEVVDPSKDPYHDHITGFIIVIVFVFVFIIVCYIGEYIKANTLEETKEIIDIDNVKYSNFLFEKIQI